MTKSFFLLTLILFVFTIFCSDRDRTNPLDPQNAETHGKISGLSIYSQERTIHLSWDRLGISKIDSVNIYRQISNNEFHFLTSVSQGASSYTDRNIQYGNSYQYYVTAKAGAYETPPSAQVEVKPGPTYLWVGDVGDGMFSRLTHDLSAVIFNFGSLRFPSLIAVVPRERSAWCYSLFSDVIYKLSGEGTVEVVLRDFGRITDIAADTTNGELWISQGNYGRILRVHKSGELRASVETLVSPASIRVDSKRHVAWVIDDSSKSVFRMTRAGFINVKNKDTLINPQDIALSGPFNSIWIADDTRIIEMDYSGNFTGVAAEGFTNAFLIDMDITRNNIWVMDRGKSGTPSTLIKLDATGKTLFQLSNFTAPTSIDVNEFDGSCMVSDPGSRAIFKVSEDGTEIQRLDGFISPQILAVEHH
jgi:hypothetical protein